MTNQTTSIMNRRTFIQTTGLGAVALTQALGAERPSWPIGCFNRAWTRWSYDDALDGIKGAGYNLTGFLTAQRGEPFTSSAASPEYLNSLKKRLAQRALTANVTAIHFRPEAALADNITDLRQQIEN